MRNQLRRPRGQIYGAAGGDAATAVGERTVAAVIAGLLLLSACSEGAAPPPVPDIEVAGADNQPLPNAGDPPKECSRDTVEKGDSYFVPSAADVARFEKALDDGLKSGALYGTDYFAALKAGRYSDAPAYAPQSIKRWDRRYMGIVRNGRRTVYGDFSPLFMDMDGKPGSVARGFWSIVVCDGGPMNFGAEFDLTDGTVRIIGFNGHA